MKKILIVEGNLREENESFSENGIQTHTESLKDSLSHYTNELLFDMEDDFGNIPSLDLETYFPDNSDSDSDLFNTFSSPIFTSSTPKKSDSFELLNLENTPPSYTNRFGLSHIGNYITDSFSSLKYSISNIFSNNSL